MSKEFFEERAKREVERLARFKVTGNKFNNLFLQFRAFYEDGVDYVCSLLGTPSVAKVYDLFLENPQFVTFDKLVSISHYSIQTVRKAIKRLRWFGVIELLDEEPETWCLTLKNWADYGSYPQTVIEE